MDHLRGHRARQAGAHCRQRIVEQHRVGRPRRIIAREPDFVDAVVEADDPVRRHRLANPLDEAGREDREALVAAERLRVLDLRPARGQHLLEVPGRGGDDVLLDLPDRVGDVADHLDLREIDRVDRGGVGRDVDDLGAAALHEERRLLDHVVADIDDHIRGLDRLVAEIAGRERRAAQEFGMGLVDHALAELGGDEGYAGLLDELEQHPAGHLAVGAGANDEDRRTRRLQLLDCGPHALFVGERPADEAALQRRRVRLLLGDVLGKFDMGGAGLFLLGEAEGLADPARDIVGAGQLVRELGDRAHHVDHIEDLEAALLRFLDRLLAGDHQDRHAAKLRIGRGGHEIGRARAQGRDADAGLAGVPPVGRGHEAGALLVARQDQLDRGRAREAVEEIQILLAGHAEHIFDAFFLEAVDEQVRSFGHSRWLRSPDGMLGTTRGRADGSLLPSKS
jgi:hypothetical protein